MLPRFPSDTTGVLGVGALTLGMVLGGCSDANPTSDGGSGLDTTASTASPGTDGGSVSGSSAASTGDAGTTGPGTSTTNGSTSDGNASSDSGSTSATGAGGTMAGGTEVSSIGGMSNSSDTASSSFGGGTEAGSTVATSVGGMASSTDGDSTVSSTDGVGGTGSVLDDLCPSGIVQTISVGASGADFSSVQAAVDSLPNGSSTPTRIDIQSGTYTEKLSIAGRSHLCLVGEDPNATILTYDDSNSDVGSTSGSASVHIDADDFSAANLTIRNTYGTGSQAVALRTTGERQQFYNCRFVGYQDTLYTHQGTQYFRDCYVQGSVDYVFGHATAVLENCEVRNVAGGSAVSAPNTELSQGYGIVFLGGRFTAEGSVSQGSVALGRPWGADGAGAYLNVELGAHISPAGFVEMSGNQPENARFREYQSTGPGAAPSQHASYQMSASEAANYTLSQIFPSWVPSYSE